MSLRLRAFQAFARNASPSVARLLAPGARIACGADDARRLRSLPLRGAELRVWFHAASVGELESLWGVAEAWVDEMLEECRPGEGRKARPEVILSVFSQSAQGAVERLAESLRVRGAEVLFAGYSPWEGGWREILARSQPAAFVTAKYEAWPDLWASVGELGIPLVIVGAQARPSLRIGRRLCRWLGVKLPRLILVPALAEDREALLELFPGADVSIVAEPRWDRIQGRAAKGSPRAQELVRLFGDAARPWGVFGSVWPEDLGVWKETLRTCGGTLWMVPHRIDEETLGDLERGLRQAGLEPLRTSEATVAGAKVREGSQRVCLVVNEMGFLSELYASADWAYVGGGFGKGVHSTMEPALHGIPVGCGPARAERFAEITQLRRWGQLEILRTADEVKGWVARIPEFLERRAEWKAQCGAQLGGARRVAEILGKIMARKNATDR